MDQSPPDERVDLDSDRFVSLSFSRVWPKYVAFWSVRIQRGEADFPLASGQAERLPASDATPSDLWALLRDEALDQATHAAAANAPAAETRKVSLIQRLFGRPGEK